MEKATNILMCPGNLLQYPKDYRNINVWMKEKHTIDYALVQMELEGVCKYIEFCNAHISCINHQADLPDMFFVRNAGLVLPSHGDSEKKQVILASFKHRERQDEQKFYRQWFEQNGFEVIVLPMGVTFEGGGEAIFCGNQLFFGHGFRAPKDTLTHLQYALDEARMEADIIPLKLVDERFYHLDTAFMPISGDGVDTKDALVYYPGAFDKESLTVISALPINKIEVTEADACAFGCNLLAIGNNIIMAKGTRKLSHELKARGFIVYEADMAEIKKGGGSVYCMTLNI
ncbi:MAG: hypothetical protein HYT28_01570 [Parcubacteria group bacterium]|nr:hypothetical protein [Parcubacteria group bacterium]